MQRLTQTNVNQFTLDLSAKCDDMLVSMSVCVSVCGTLGVVFSSLRVYCYFHFLEEEVINRRVGD